MNRYIRVYADVDQDEHWIAVGMAWCQTATVPLCATALRLIADTGCDVWMISLN